MYMEVYRILIVSAKKEWKDAALVPTQSTHTYIVHHYIYYVHVYIHVHVYML